MYVDLQQLFFFFSILTFLPFLSPLFHPLLLSLLLFLYPSAPSSIHFLIAILPYFLSYLPHTLSFLSWSMQLRKITSDNKIFNTSSIKCMFRDGCKIPGGISTRSETVLYDRKKKLFYLLTFFKSSNWSVLILSKCAFAENFIKIGRLITPSALIG